MRRIRTHLIIGTSIFVFSALSYGLFHALRSPLFLTRVVEVSDLPVNAPIDAQSIIQLADVPVGKQSLFQLDLALLEEKLLSHPWIREVRLQKRLPQTLVIGVVFREPKALIQKAGGTLSYVDVDGRVFGKVNLAVEPDKPILTGLSPEHRDKIQEALKLIDAWDRSSFASLPAISSLSFDTDRGFRALVAYPLSKKTPAGARLMTSRAMVSLGHEYHQDFDAHLTRLSDVFKYLETNGIAVRQIWADTGKKIVVKIARGS